MSLPDALSLNDLTLDFWLDQAERIAGEHREA